MSTFWDDTLFVFAPLALFGVLALVAGLISAIIERVERRRARLFAPPPRRAWRFRPVVIEGGKVAPAVAEDAPTVSSSTQLHSVVLA